MHSIVNCDVKVYVRTNVKLRRVRLAPGAVFKGRSREMLHRGIVFRCLMPNALKKQLENSKVLFLFFYILRNEHKLDYSNT